MCLPVSVHSHTRSHREQTVDTVPWLIIIIRGNWDLVADGIWAHGSSNVWLNDTKHATLSRRLGVSLHFFFFLRFLPFPLNASCVANDISSLVRKLENISQVDISGKTERSDKRHFSFLFK